MPNNIGDGFLTAPIEGAERNRAWIDRQTSSPEARREYEQERLILWATDTVCQAFAEHNRSKADIARTLGTSRANITQLLSGSRNITLRSLADLAWACDKRVSVRLEPLRYGEFVSTPVLLLRPSAAPRVVCEQEDEPARISAEAVELSA